MRSPAPIFLTFLTSAMLADEVTKHHFNASGHHLAAGWPQDHLPKLLVIAEKTISLQFEGLSTAGLLSVQLHRITYTRKIPLEAPAAESTPDGWQWTWTPPKTRGPAHYEVIFGSEPKRIVHIESRDPARVKATLDMLVLADWTAEGLSHEELAALASHGLRIAKSNSSGKADTASLQMLPKQGDASRRRIVWDKDNPTLVVWKPGPATGDVEVRAPRWWISPAALATDEGLIRFLDLFSEPPLNP